MRRRVFRGNSWDGCYLSRVRVGVRNRDVVRFRYGDVGFRCVRD